MMVLLIVELAVLLALYIIYRGRFSEELSLLNMKKDRLKPLLPIGFGLMALFGHKYRTQYERKLEAKLRELKGTKDAHGFLKIHIAGNAVLMLFALSFATLVGTQVEVDSAYIFFSLTLLGALFYAYDRQLDDKIKERKRSIQIEFPELLSKLILLVNAGLPVSGAIRKIVKDSRKGSPLYTELAMTVNEINSGKSEVQSYEDFAKRCRQPEVTMFAGALIQNLRKGNDELIPLLRLQANTCWENRKNIARKLGEEASTKLLLPMIIVFIAIIVMIMTPAVLQLHF